MRAAGQSVSCSSWEVLAQRLTADLYGTRVGGANGSIRVKRMSVAAAVAPAGRQRVRHIEKGRI